MTTPPSTYEGRKRSSSSGSGLSPLDNLSVAQLSALAPFGCYSPVPSPFPQYPPPMGQLPLTPTPPPTPDSLPLLSAAAVQGGKMEPLLSPRTLLSQITGMQQPNGADFGVGNAFMDPRWSSMGQFYAGSMDAVGLEKRAQFKTDLEVRTPYILSFFTRERI